MINSRDTQPCRWSTGGGHKYPDGSRKPYDHLWSGGGTLDGDWWPKRKPSGGPTLNNKPSDGPI